jgi:hypothetical protein
MIISLCVYIMTPGTPLAKLDEYLKMTEGSIQVPISKFGCETEEDCSALFIGVL